MPMNVLNLEKKQSLMHIKQMRREERNCTRAVRRSAEGKKEEEEGGRPSSDVPRSGEQRATRQRQWRTKITAMRFLLVAGR